MELGNSLVRQMCDRQSRALSNGALDINFTNVRYYIDKERPASQPTKGRIEAGELDGRAQDTT
jgi:hypothetical protein